MIPNEAGIAYEHALSALVEAGHRELAKALVDMGLPMGAVLGDPYFQKHYGRWVNNAVANHRTLSSRASKRQLCISALPVSDKPAIVCGSGYSLNAALPLLKEWKGDIICGNSNVLTLIAHGITPTYLVVLDSHPTIADLLCGYKRWPQSTRLITHPTIAPGLLAGWTNPSSYYLVQRKHFELFEAVFPAMFAPLGIKVGLQWRICVVNNEVQIAGTLGKLGRPIFLVGCDFGWKDRAKHRCMTFVPTLDGKDLYEKSIGPIPQDDDPKRADYDIGVDDNGWEYTGDMIFLRDELYRTWWHNQVAVIDCSWGSVTELPRARLEDVVACQGRDWYGMLEKRHEHAKRVADYLNRRDAVKQEQYRKIVEEYHAKMACGDSSGGGPDPAIVG